MTKQIIPKTSHGSFIGDMDGLMQKDVTPLLTHWSYVSVALIHRLIDGLAQNCSNLSAVAMESLQFCAKPSPCWQVRQRLTVGQCDDPGSWTNSEVSGGISVGDGKCGAIHSVCVRTRDCRHLGAEMMSLQMDIDCITEQTAPRIVTDLMGSMIEYTDAGFGMMNSVYNAVAHYCNEWYVLEWHSAFTLKENQLFMGCDVMGSPDDWYMYHECYVRSICVVTWRYNKHCNRCKLCFHWLSYMWWRHTK